jgi:hypothetical protein
MTVILIGAGQLANPVKQWVKATCRDDVAHFIVCKKGDELHTSCQMTLAASKACTARSGVRLCETCLAGVIEREKHQARKQRAGR